MILQPAISIIAPQKTKKKADEESNDSSSAFRYHSKETGLVSPVANALEPGPNKG